MPLKRIHKSRKQTVEPVEKAEEQRAKNFVNDGLLAMQVRDVDGKVIKFDKQGRRIK